MKSIASKKKVKSYVRLFVFLFILAILSFFLHLNEDPLNVDQMQVRQRYDEEKARAGYKAPRFTLKNLRGEPTSLEDFRGKVVLLNFWATWCAPCRVEMPSFESLYRQYRSKGLTVVAVSLDKTGVETVREFVDERGLSFPILLDLEGQAEKLYPSFSIPATYVIDRSGHVVTQVDGAKNWESKETFEAVEFLLNQSLAE